MRVTNGKLLHFVEQCRFERIVHATLNEDARAAETYLSLVREGCARNVFCNVLNVYIIKHDRRVLATELQREFRRGDIQFSGLDDLPEPGGPEEDDARPARWRRVVSDLLQTLYF